DTFTIRNTVVRRLVHPARSVYDLIVIDCQPTLGILQRNALAAATHLLFPVQLQKAALNGLDRIMNVVDELSEINPELGVLGSVPYMYERTLISRQIERELSERYWAKTTDTCIPKAKDFGEAYYAAEPVGSYAPSSKAARSLRKLTRELTQRLSQ
ncbi:MAG: ParA family protein, partial [Myxococcota bacterium]